MPADLPPAELHPDDAAAFEALFDQLADVASALALGGLAATGLAAKLDQHHDLERYAPVLRVAERLTTAATLVTAAVQLLDLAEHLERPLPPVPPAELPDAPAVPPRPAPDERPVTVRTAPRRESPAEPPRVPTEGERTGGPFIARPTESQARQESAASMRAAFEDLQTVELPRVTTRTATAALPAVGPFPPTYDNRS